MSWEDPETKWLRDLAADAAAKPEFPHHVSPGREHCDYCGFLFPDPVEDCPSVYHPKRDSWPSTLAEAQVFLEHAREHVHRSAQEQAYLANPGEMFAMGQAWGVLREAGKRVRRGEL